MTDRPSVGPAGGTTPDTRERVMVLLVERGSSTVPELAAALGLTQAAVRRHLDALVAEGLAEEHAPRAAVGRGRGRPPRRFTLTARGRAELPAAYDDLAASALRFLADSVGDAAVAAFARARLAEIEARYRAALADTPTDDRARVLAEALSADGYAASTEPTTGEWSGVQVCQHHCPVAVVAEQFPQLCEAETEAFSRLLGTHVSRLATIAHGDGVCTTFVPTPTRPDRPAPRERTPA